MNRPPPDRKKYSHFSHFFYSFHQETFEFKLFFLSSSEQSISRKSSITRWKIVFSPLNLNKETRGSMKMCPVAASATRTDVSAAWVGGMQAPGRSWRNLTVSYSRGLYSRTKSSLEALWGLLCWVGDTFNHDVILNEKMSAETLQSSRVGQAAENPGATSTK